MTIDAAGSTPYLTTIGQPGQIHAPQDQVNQFRALLGNVERSLGQGTTSLNDNKKQSAWSQVSLLEDTALRVDRAQQAVDRLATDIRQSTSKLKDVVSTNSDFTRNIVQQQFTTAYYFVGIARLENSASNFSEELSSLTKGR